MSASLFYIYGICGWPVQAVLEMHGLHNIKVKHMIYHRVHLQYIFSEFQISSVISWMSD